MVELVVPASEAEVEYVVQIVDTDEHGREVGTGGWYTVSTHQTLDQANLYHEGMRKGLNDEMHRLTGKQQSPVRSRVARAILQAMPPKTSPLSS